MYYYLGGKFIYCGYPATEENPYDFAMSQQDKYKEPHYTKRNELFDKCVNNCDPATMKEVSDKVDEWNKKPCLTCQEYEKGYKQGRLEGVTAGYNQAVKEMEEMQKHSTKKF